MRLNIIEVKEKVNQPTYEQLAFLVKVAFKDSIKSKQDAAKMIEKICTSPTKKQIEFLEEHGYKVKPDWTKKDCSDLIAQEIESWEDGFDMDWCSMMFDWGGFF